ncbi:flavin reductase [Mucilaginibacter sp. 21P]|uniref:flavin reductase family protein n=1 Tax=Mucilaginibacter sp. 21P TaxID=2778902 RepID=UPI001C579C75|nr:flavin reductase [Mucilaginibacter sp. 21P]QXV66739.1 flavin reductase [Mucilaginibacter sp. 21P]
MKNFKNDEIGKMEKFYRMNLINSLIGFRALNLLGTANDDGVSNLCIISSTFHLGANPPLIGLVMRPQREHNDTLKNILSSGQYTLNNILPDLYKQAHQTSASYPSGDSEFKECGFEELYIDGFKAPFVQEANVRIGLELRKTIDVDLNGTTIVIGKIMYILTEDGLIGNDGMIDHYKAGTITAAGLDSYYTIDPLGRLAYAKPYVAPHEI